MRLLRFTLILTIVLFAFSCKKDKQPAIPYVFVNEILYPNSLDFINVSGYKYINAGYRGIVIYRLSNEEFRVYERCCPYDPEKANAKIIVEANNITAIDTVCKSRFSLVDGVPFQGPSRYSLMTYNYSYDGEKLLIYN